MDKKVYCPHQNGSRSTRVNVKSVLKITGIVFALFIAAIIVLAFVIDANSFKPRIQAAAAEHGIALNMRGDLRWAFWPAIGVAVNEVSLADSANPQAILADVKKASLLVAFVPLLKGDLQVKHVLVDGAAINLAVNEQGVGNWENILKQKDAPANPPPEQKTDTKVLTLSVEKISLHDSQINYMDAVKGSQLALSNINLDVKDVNLNGDPFELSAAWDTLLSQSKTKQVPAQDSLHIKSKLRSSVAIGEGMNSLTLDKGELELAIHAKNSTSIKVQYSVKINDLKNNLTYQGKLAIPALNAKQLLVGFGIPYKTANEKALTDISFSSDIKGDKKSIAFNPLTVKIDKTRLDGSIVVTDFASQALAVDLKGDDINADDYLPPPLPAPVPTVDGKTPAPAPVSAAVAATGNEPLVPVELLRKLNVSTKLALNSILFSKLQMEKVLLEADAKHGLAQFNLNANAYAGNIHAKNSVDARSNNPQLRFDVIAKGVNIAPILKDKGFDKKMQLSGSLHANANGQASGISKNQILESLIGNFNFSGDKMRLAPLNVEQEFCKLVNLVNKEDGSQTTWNAYTELQPLSGKATIAKRVITVESVSANVTKLVLGTTGNINLVNGSYDFLLPLKLNRDANDTPNSIFTSAQGCKVSSNYWVERSLTLLRCKGAYAQMDPAKDCRPDKDQLNGLIKDFAAYKLKEKHGAKIEEEKSKLLKKLDDKLGGEGKSEQTKDLLKSLFKKKDDKPKEDKPKDAQ
jgi:AsmA protein